MKFIVIVNQKYLVTEDADTHGGAEHKILDNIYYGVETCQAFSMEEITTDIFKALAKECETISHSELYDKAREYKAKNEEIEKQKKQIEEYKNQIKELEKTIRQTTISKELAENNLKCLMHNLSNL